MATTLFPEMARATFRPLVERLEERERDVPPDEVRELLAAAGLAAAVLDKLWEMFQEMLSRGSEAGLLSPVIDELASVVSLAADAVFPRVRALASDVLPADNRQPALRALEDSAVRAAAMRAELSALSRWLAAPPRLDPATLDVPPEPGRFEDSREVAARLAAGGDV